MQKALGPVIFPSVLIISVSPSFVSFPWTSSTDFSFFLWHYSLRCLLSFSSSPTPVVQFSLFLKRKFIKTMGVWVHERARVCVCVWKPKNFPHPSHYYRFHNSWTRSPQAFRQNLGGRRTPFGCFLFFEHLNSTFETFPDFSLAGPRAKNILNI